MSKTHHCFGAVKALAGQRMFSAWSLRKQKVRTAVCVLGAMRAAGGRLSVSTVLALLSCTGLLPSSTSTDPDTDFCPIPGRFHSISDSNRLKKGKGGCSRRLSSCSLLVLL